MVLVLGMNCFVSVYFHITTIPWLHKSTRNYLQSVHKCKLLVSKSLLTKALGLPVCISPSFHLSSPPLVHRQKSVPVGKIAYQSCGNKSKCNVEWNQVARRIRRLEQLGTNDSCKVAESIHPKDKGAFARLCGIYQSFLLVKFNQGDTYLGCFQQAKPLLEVLRRNFQRSRYIDQHIELHCSNLEQLL